MVLKTEWDQSRQGKDFRPRELHQLASIARHPISPKGKITEIAKLQKRSYNAVKQQVYRMRKTRSWEFWMLPQETDFSRFKD